MSGCAELNLAAARTRLVGLPEEPPVPGPAPRVLGVDAFTFRRGRRYGTILVDVDAGPVVGVLPDRTSETFAAWLTAHPGTEIICRDRTSSYPKAIKEASPAALQIADRWHLLQNLSDAVGKTCHQHRPCLKKPAGDPRGPGRAPHGGRVGARRGVARATPRTGRADDHGRGPAAQRAWPTVAMLTVAGPMFLF